MIIKLTDPENKKLLVNMDNAEYIESFDGGGALIYYHNIESKRRVMESLDEIQKKYEIALEEKYRLQYKMKNMATS